MPERSLLTSALGKATSHELFALSLPDLCLAAMGISIRGSIVASIPACHAGVPGSIPGRGVFIPEELCSAVASIQRHPQLRRQEELRTALPGEKNKLIYCALGWLGWLPGLAAGFFCFVNTDLRLNSTIRGSIVASISACHADDPGTIPGRGVSLERWAISLHRYCYTLMLQ